MRFLLPALVFVLVLLSACRADYDISEVAPEEFMDSTDEHDHEDDEPCDCEDSTHVHDVNVQQSIDAADSLVLSSSRHQHDEGVRNHGTQWFFNQPWAASFIWGKMLRDAVILLILAGSILLLNRAISRRGR